MEVEEAIFGKYLQRIRLWKFSKNAAKKHPKPLIRWGMPFLSLKWEFSEPKKKT